jgi:von Willebrand factor type A domain/Aerotolerance regulator N-terminal
VSFVTALGLAVALLVVAPYLAHRLRRRRADERPFAAARLVPPAPPRARRRSRLEDRLLFSLRALCVVALAVLGAAPLVRCSRLSLHREGGASVALAIVIDDSMSMRAPPASRVGTRFDRARSGARELLASSREGDAVALVLAGTPPRVALAATTDLAAAHVALDAVTQTDRGTDLDGAVAMARALVSQLPQVDKRVVLLSDLADGRSDGPPLGEGGDIPVWVPLAELRADAEGASERGSAGSTSGDCGVLAADRGPDHVRVTIACGHGATASGREVTLRAGEKILGRAAAPPGGVGDVRITIASDAPADLVARLDGADAIAVDDVATVVAEAAAPAIAVIADAPDETTVTGGAPIVEQALASLRLDFALRPIPSMPDRAVDFEGFVGLIADDPAGFTPEQRRALGAFIEQGGEALLALGSRAAAAPLGASFEPVLAHSVGWGATSAKGAAAAYGSAAAFSDTARSLGDLGARGRATLAPEDAKSFESLLAWDDGPPFVARRTIGRGGAWIVTLPFAVDTSDLTLRPGFLALLDAWLDEARGRVVPLRVDVGHPWTFLLAAQKGGRGARDLVVEGPAGALPIVRDGAVARVVPSLVGSYAVTIGGRKETRVAAPLAAEMDLRPRATAAVSQGGSLGETHASVDISWGVALVLLALVAAELALRVQRTTRPDAVA